MKGILYILCAYLIGEALSMLTMNLISGSVLGMITLFAALKTGVVKSGDIKAAAQTLLDNMLLFFVPVSAGLLVSWELIAGDMAAVLSVIIITTLLVLTLVGWLQQKTGRTKNG